MNKRTLDPKVRARIVAAGRRKERGSTGELAEEFGVDAPIVRRVLQAAGLAKADAATRAKATRLVETWIARHAAGNGSGRKATRRKAAR
jgi:hypothetical protein